MPKTAPLRISATLRRRLDRVSKAEGRSAKAFAEDALRRRLALAEWRQVAKKLRADLKRRGLGDLTEEDVFRMVS